MPPVSSARAAENALRALETHRFRWLLLAMLALMILTPVFGESEVRGEVLGPVGVLLLAALLLVLSGSRWVFLTALLLALSSGGSLLDDGVGGLAGSGYHAPLFLFAAVVVARGVLLSERADEDTLAGSLCAFLLLALAFASLYAAIESAWPGSFAFSAGASEQPFDSLFYFSLVTITTLGYGDITPVGELAIGLASLESLIGILYPSFVVARIVALLASGAGRPFAAPRQEAGERPGRFELLVGIGALSLVAQPALQDRGPGSVLLDLLATGLLLSALYAAGGGRASRSIGLALAAVTLVLRWLPEAHVALDRASLAMDLVFYGFVIGSLSVWLARERRVTRSVLFACAGLHMLLGFAWASAYELAESVVPGSIAMSAGQVPLRSHFVYYSFMTLTTTGFGDITPGSQLVERLATLESLVGIFFPAILVARLVSLYQSD